MLLLATGFSADFEALDGNNYGDGQSQHFVEKYQVFFLFYEDDSKTKKGYGQNLIPTLLQLEIKAEYLKSWLLLIALKETTGYIFKTNKQKRLLFGALFKV